MRRQRLTFRVPAAIVARASLASRSAIRRDALDAGPSRDTAL